MKKPVRRIGLAVAAIGLVALIGGLGRWAYVAHRNAQLLLTDGDILPSRAALTHFAAIEAAPIYARDCAACHGPDLKGNRSSGVPDLTDHDWLYGQGRITDIELTITYGIRSHQPRARDLANMPAFARAQPDTRDQLNPLTPRQIDDVISYLFSIERRGAPDRAAVQRGEKVFSLTGGCYDCHGSDAEGDNFVGAPNLRDNIWLYGDGSRASLFRSIAQGHVGLCPGWSRRLSPAQIRALAVFIYLRSHPSTADTAKAAGKAAS